MRAWPGGIIEPGTPDEAPPSAGEKGRGVTDGDSSELDHLPGPHALVGGENDAQRVDRIFKMLAKIDLTTDRLEEQALLALAELLMAGLVLGQFDLIGMGEGAVGFEPGMMNAQRIGPGVIVVVGGFDAHVRLLIGHDRNAAFGPDHVLHEERGFADHRAPAALVPADRAIIEGEVQVAVIHHRRRDFIGEPRADRVNGDRLRPRHLAHDVDIMHAAVHDRRSRAHEVLVHLPERARRLLIEVHAHHERLAERAADLDEARP